MSLVSTMRASAAPLYTPPTDVDPTRDHVPFNQQPTYLTLSRMLIRYQHIVLLYPPSDGLTPLQSQVQNELSSPLPYHRTKWLHNIEYARTLLLQLEHAAQGIKVQRVKRDMIRDLAGKRVVIRKLRNRIEEMGREIDAMGEEAWRQSEPGQTLEEILGRRGGNEEGSGQLNGTRDETTVLQDGKPVAKVSEDLTPDNAATILDGKPYTTQSPNDQRFRRRGKQPSQADPNTATTSGFSNLPETERTLLSDSRTQEDLTVSLVSMAAQLKQSARNFQFSLDQDKTLLDRAIEGLDKNVSGMEAASKSMAFLRRMNEDMGLWGRLQLYAMIFGLWVVAVLLVFVGPKFRF